MKAIRLLLMMTLVCFAQAANAQGSEGEKSKPKLTDEQREALEIRLNNVRTEMHEMRADLSQQLDSLTQIMRELDMKPAKDTTRKNDRYSVSVSGDGLKVDFPTEQKDNAEVKLDPFQTSWFLFDLGINPYLYDNSFTLPDSSGLDLNYSRSVHVGLHIFQQAVRLGTDKFWLRYGLTIDYHNFSFEDDIILTPDTNHFAFTASEVPLKKSKLTTQSLLVPVMLQFESKAEERNKSFRIIVGGYGGYTFRTYAKNVTEDKKKSKVIDDFNVDQIRYGVTARIGVSRFTLYANYDLSPLFEEGKGPELYPFSAGIVINGFDFN